jgi:hypothetical protein
MGEGSVLDWLSVAALGATAVVAAAGALFVPGRRWRFALLGAILAFLAVDDALALHERVTSAVAGRLAIADHADTLFLLPYLPLLGLAFWLLWTSAVDVGRRRVRLGLALLVCALAARALAALVTATGLALAPWERTVGVAAMHDAELLAWLLLASGLAACVARPGRRT